MESTVIIYRNVLDNISIVELIYNTYCDYRYDYIKQVAYLCFATCTQAKKFQTKMRELLATIEKLENIYNNVLNNIDR